MALTQYTVRIQRNRLNRNGETESAWQEFRVEAEPQTTVLSILDEIRGHQDGSVTYRVSCRSAICGSCAMKMNGRTRLACKTHIGKVAVNGVVELAPQANQPVIKDLVIDISPFFQKIKKITPFLQEGPEADTQVNRRSFDQVNHVTQCIMCGSCYSDCTMAEVSPEFIGPAALAKAFRFVSDPREGQKTLRLKQLAEPHMAWSCSRCVMCVETCPKDVAPMEAIVKLRTRSLAAGNKDSAGARHALAFHEDIQKSGDLNEFTLMMRTLGLVGTMKELGAAFHFMKKGKIPSPFPHKPAGLEELGRIFAILEANPLDVETKAKEVVPE